jgi:hypothetical protein
MHPVKVPRDAASRLPHLRVCLVTFQGSYSTTCLHWHNSSTTSCFAHNHSEHSSFAMAVLPHHPGLRVSIVSDDGTALREYPDNDASRPNLAQGSVSVGSSLRHGQLILFYCTSTLMGNRLTEFTVTLTTTTGEGHTRVLRLGPLL